MTDGLFAFTDGGLDRRRTVQCALSRVCGACGQSLGRPIAFLGDPEEVARGCFHLPPLHVACAESARPLLGDERTLVLTSGFEFIRPTREDVDREPRFVPNSLL